ncbi:MAG: bifunctional metallophosphatase/5'-nucleotidase [Myxococcales bacterium]|nr:bifunctional metallophosphatase/5'-nucleotidase [Myxococcales bacterium]
MPTARIVALSLALMAAAWAAQAAPVTLVFLGTTDIHGHLEPIHAELTLDGGAKAVVDRGGLPLFAGYLENARRAHPGRVVLLDAGDMLQGTLVSNLGEGAATVRAMNALGYAAVAVGNHEFDFGPVGARATPKEKSDDPLGALRARAAESRHAWLTANVRDAGTGLPAGAPSVRAFVVIDVAGVKVGLLGATSEDTPRTTHAANLVGLRVDPIAPSVIKAAAAARAAGATVVVLAVHAGGECARFEKPEDLSSCVAASEVFELARALPRGTVDAIFAGHTHQGVSSVVNGIPIAQAFSYGSHFARIDLTVDGATGKVIAGGARIHPPTEVCAARTDGVPSCDPRRARGKRIVPEVYEGRAVAADPKVAAAFAGDIARAALLRAERVGVRLETPFLRSHRAESALGNLVADLLRAAVPGAHLGITNGGGLRADLPSGDLTYGALFEALPFDNRVAVVRMQGATLRRLIGANLAGEKGILSLSGVRAQATCRGDALAVVITLDDGRPLDDAATYVVATSDFLANGGDDFAALGPKLASGAVVIDETAPVLRDQVAALLARKKTLRADDRVIFDPARPRVGLPAPRPFRCTAGVAR